MIRRNRRHIPNKPRKPPNTDPYQSILNLNDDCMYVLLTYLPLQDLCSIATTCRRINETAERLYSRFANLDAQYFLTKNRHNLTTERKMGKIIEQIARHVISFQISAKIEEENNVNRCETLIKLVLIHCHNIVALDIHFSVSDRFSQEISALENFQKLETIQMSSNIQLENLNKLKNLYIINFIKKTTFNFMMLKNLDSLCIDSHLDVETDVFSQICDRNPGLKKLKITLTYMECMNIIITKLIHLEDLTLFSTPGEWITGVAKIKTLKRFRTDESAPDLLAKLVELDQLELLSYHINPLKDEPELITKFTKLIHLQINNFNDSLLNSLKSIRNLELVDLDNSVSCTNEGVLNFVKNANNLKYLSLCECYNCDEDIFEMLTELIKTTSRKLKLTIKSDFIRCYDKEIYPLINIIVVPYRDEHEYYSS